MILLKGFPDTKNPTRWWVSFVGPRWVRSVRAHLQRAESPVEAGLFRATKPARF